MYRKVVMEMRDAASPETTHPYFSGWTVEALWWAREIWRDAVRAAWHASLSKTYERAANDPDGPVPSEPREPYPDIGGVVTAAELE